jgi:hypothetical protein
MAKKDKIAARTKVSLVFGREILEMFVKQGKSMGLTLSRHVPNPDAGQTLYFLDPLHRTQHKLRVAHDGRLIEKENDRHPPVMRELHAAVAEQLPCGQGRETEKRPSSVKKARRNPAGRHVHHD